MNKENTAELKDFRAEVVQWMEKNRPKPPKFMLPLSFLEVSTDDQFYYLRDWQQKVYEAGYLGMAWPKEYGGYGQSQVKQDIVDEEMARASVPLMVNVIGLSWAGPTVLNMGSEEQKKKYLKKILSGEDIWCQGFSEPEHGSDLGSLQTTARHEGNSYIINGRKIWTTLANYAKHMILIARTDPDAASKFYGLSYFLSPMDVPGIEVSPIRKMTGEYGFCEVLFENAAIPEDCLMGGEGQGWTVAMATLAFERGAAGGQGGGRILDVGIAADLVELARASKRDGQPAIEDPVIRDHIVNFIIQERIIALNRRRGEIPGLIGERPHALLLMDKLVKTEYMQKVAEFAVKIQGGNAGLYEGDPNAIAEGFWQRFYMNSFGATIGGGTSEVLRNIISERLLGLPKG